MKVMRWIILVLFYLIKHCPEMSLAASDGEEETATTSELLPKTEEENFESASSPVDVSSPDQHEMMEQLLVMALVHRFAQISERIIAPYKDFVELQTLEPIQKMLTLVQSVALNELLFQRRNGKFDCRQDLPDLLQNSAGGGNTDFVKRIFMTILHNDNIILDQQQDKLIMTKQLMDGGVNSLKMLFSFAARLAAAVGGDDTILRTFLLTCSCLDYATNSNEAMLFGLRIEPKLDMKGQAMSFRLGWKKYTEDQQRISKANFKFLQLLSKEELTARDVVSVCQKIDISIGRGGAMVGQDSAATKLFSKIDAHFTSSSNNEIHQQKMPAPVRHWQQSIMLCSMAKFGENLLKRISEHQNFEKYFEAIGVNAKNIVGTKIDNGTKIAILLKSLNVYRNKYCSTFMANVAKKDAFQFYEKFLHYENAIFIDWNPWRELVHTIDNVRSKLITDGVFKNTFNYSAKNETEFGKTIAILEHKYVEEMVCQQNDTDKRYGLVDKVSFWQKSVHQSEKAGTDVLSELEEIRAKFQQNADEFDQAEMLQLI